VPSISPSEKTSPSILWQRLTALKVFEAFSDKERDAFLQAYEHDPALCMRRFAPGDLVCRKGEYGLDHACARRAAVAISPRAEHPEDTV
jgi:hypothetical protein